MSGPQSREGGDRGHEETRTGVGSGIQCYNSPPLSVTTLHHSYLSVTQCYNSPPLLFRYSVSVSVTLYSTDRR